MVQGCTVVFRAPNVHGLPLDGTLKLQYMRGEAKGEFAIVKVAHILGIRIPRPNCHPAPLPAIQVPSPLSSQHFNLASAHCNHSCLDAMSYIHLVSSSHAHVPGPCDGFAVCSRV